MIFLLPPSETKRDGGVPGTVLDFEALSYPALGRPRRTAAAALVRLSRDVESSMAALKLGPRLRNEVQRNRLLKKSPTMPAIERYTGVVYDPIAASSLSQGAQQWAGEHVAIHSALFGVIGALDPIPAYRLSHDSRIADVPLRALWAAPVAKALASRHEVVVDLRSEAYVELGTAPPGSVYARIVSDADGRRRALNHFNKKTKGTLISRLLVSRPELSSVDDFIEWTRSEGIRVDRQGREIIIVSESLLDDGSVVSR